MKIKKLKIISLFLMAFFVFGCVDKQEEKTKPAPAPKPPVVEPNQPTIDDINKDLNPNPAPTNLEKVKLTINLKDKNSQNMVDVRICPTKQNENICIYETKNIDENGNVIFNLPKEIYKIKIIFNPWILGPENTNTDGLVIGYIKNFSTTNKFLDAQIIDLKNNSNLNIIADVENFK